MYSLIKYTDSDPNFCEESIHSTEFDAFLWIAERVIENLEGMGVDYDDHLVSSIVTAIRGRDILGLIESTNKHLETIDSSYWSLTKTEILGDDDPSNEEIYKNLLSIVNDNVQHWREYTTLKQMER